MIRVFTLPRFGVEGEPGLRPGFQDGRNPQRIIRGPTRINRRVIPCLLAQAPTNPAGGRVPPAEKFRGRLDVELSSAFSFQVSAFCR
jgi:hypothetical protein